VTGETRDRIVREIDAQGVEAFGFAAIDELKRTNPKLLQAAHDLAAALWDYAGLMQGFALTYRCLVVQSMADRANLHRAWLGTSAPSARSLLHVARIENGENVNGPELIESHACSPVSSPAARRLRLLPCDAERVAQDGDQPISGDFRGSSSRLAASTVAPVRSARRATSSTRL
jgi:hypothetical protein